MSHASTDLTFTEDRAKRFEAYGWHVQSVDGHDRAAIGKALEAALAETGRPSIIMGRRGEGREGESRLAGGACVSGAGGCQGSV